MLQLLLPALLVMTPLALLGGVSLGAMLREEAERRRFLQRHSHRAYLLWDTRSGWHEFIVNNVLPLLPPEVEPCPRGRRRVTQRYNEGVWRLCGWRAWRSLPSLVVLSADGLTVTSLYAPLVGLRAHRRRSDEVKRLVEGKLARCMKALPGKGARAAGGLVTSTAAPGTRG